MSTITCKKCGREAPRTGPVQKYCPECSLNKDLERKKLWAVSHPQKFTLEQIERRNARKTEKRKEMLAAGAIRSSENCEKISWQANWTIDLSWSVRISLPFSYAMSKNHMFTNTRFGHRALRQQSRSYRDDITLLLKDAIRGVSIKNNKLWVDIFVQKPNHRGDAANVLDLVLDGIKDATGVDDRWYSIRRLDWEIVKDRPQLFVGIGQEECVDSIACSSCGLILALDQFSKNLSNPIGVSRDCKECRKFRHKRSA